MAEIKPLKISVEGVDKVLQSTARVQKELEDIKRIAKEKNNITLNNTQALDVLRQLKKEADTTKNSIQNIDKNVSFSRFKAAVNDVKNAVATTVAAAVIGGKTASETVNDIGQSIAGVASNFGPYGVAIGAAISLVTPLVSSLFEASDAQKALNEEMVEGKKASAALGAELGKEISALLTLTSVVQSNSASAKEKKEALRQLNEQYAPYLESLGIAKISVSNLTDATLLLTTAIVKNAIASAARGEIEKALNATITDSVEVIKAKNKVSDAANKIAQLTGVRLNTNRVISEKERKAIISSAVSLGNKREVIEGLLLQYDEYQNQLLLTNGNMGTSRANAEETAKAYAELSKSLNLGDIIKQFSALFDITNKISTPFTTKGSKGGGAKQAAKDYRQFGETVQEISEAIAEGLEDPDTSIADLERGMRELQTATNLYLNTIEGANAANDAAAKSIEKLNKANQELIATQVEAQQVQRETTDNLEREIDRSFKLLLKGKSEGDDGISIVSQDPSVTKAELKAFKARAKQIIETEKDTLVALEKVKAEGAKRGIRLARIEAKEAIIAEETAKIETTKTQLAKNAKEIEKFQKQLDQRNGEEAQKEAQRLAKEREKFQKAILDRQQKAIDNILKEELDRADEATKARIQANKASLDEFTGAIIRDTQKSITAVTDKVNPVLKEANQTLGANFFTFADDIPQIDEDLITQALTDGTLTAEQGVALQTAVKIARDTVGQIQAINAKSNAELANANLKFIQQYIANYQTLNEAQIKELTIFLDRQKILTQNAQEEEFNTIEKQVKKRRELGKKQSDEELSEIESSREDALIALQSNFEAESALRLKVREDALKQAKANGGDILLAEEELVNERLALEIEFQKKKLGIENQFDSLVDKKGKSDFEKIANEFFAFVKLLQNFSNAVIDLVNQNSQNIIDGLNEQLDTVEQRTSDTLNRIASLEDDLEGKRSGRRDAVLQALEQQRELEKQLALDKIALQKRIEQEEIKIRKRQQAASIATALINGAIAVTSILAAPSIIPEPARSIYKGIQIGLAGATTAAQVALIASQKFAHGGFTGDGTYTDDTGHKVAGVVHNDEWVAPKWMVESPQFAPVIGQLEGARQRGFADGGFTSPDFNALSNSVSGGNERKMEAMIKSYFDASMKLADRPIYTKATEVQTVANRNNQRRVSTSI